RLRCLLPLCSSMAENSKSSAVPVFGAKGAVRCGVIFLALFALLLVFAMIDRSRTPQIEQFEEVSAVGDTVYFQRALISRGSPQPIFTLNGQALYPANDQKKEVKDTNMVRAGYDEATGLTIYTPRKTRSSEAKKEQSAYFVKLGRNDYLEVRARSPGK